MPRNPPLRIQMQHSRRSIPLMQRQLDGKRRALALLALHADSAAVQQHQLMQKNRRVQTAAEGHQQLAMGMKRMRNISRHIHEHTEK